MNTHKKILWVEDFADGGATMDKFDFDQTYVHVAKDFEDALLYINTEYGKFDTVLLDINLELGNIDGDDVKKIMDDYLHPDHMKHRGKSYLKDNAGFYVYLYLLHRGFPRDRVCFLTGYKYVEAATDFKSLRIFLEENGLDNQDKVIEDQELVDKIDSFMDEPDFADIADDFMDLIENGETSAAYQYLVETEKKVENVSAVSHSKPDTYGKWDEDFAKTGIKSPIGFNKEYPEEFTKFKDWFNKTATPYYFLRYGLVSACEHLIKELNSPNPTFLRFEYSFFVPKKNRDIHDNGSGGERLFSKDYFEGLLVALKEMLPLYEPDDQVKKNLYKQMIRFIAHDWEGVVSVNRNSKVQSDKEQGFKDRTYFSIMKLLRNWSAHNKLMEFTEADVAFFLLIAFRSYFRLNTVTEGFPVQLYEEVLLQVVKPLTDDRQKSEYAEMQKRIRGNEIKLNVQFDQLRQRLISHYEKQEKEYYSMSVNLYDVLKDIGNELNDCAVKDLHIMLWYGMCNIEFKNYRENVINVNYNNKFIKILVLENRKRNDLFTQLYVRTFRNLIEEPESNS